MAIDNNKEMNRILQNPDNIILSQDLDDILLDDSEEISEIEEINNMSEEIQPYSDNTICFVTTPKKEYTAKVIKMIKIPCSTFGFCFRFVLFVPTLLLEDLFVEHFLTLNINDHAFPLLLDHKLTLEGEMLTITTRRRN